MSEWPFQVNGIDVFRPPPEGYVVDFNHPKQQKVLEHYLIFGIGAPLALIAMIQRFYTKLFLANGLQIDDGRSPSLRTCALIANGSTLQHLCFLDGYGGLSLFEFTMDTFH